MKDDKIVLYIVIPFAIGLGILFASLPIALALWILGIKL